MPFIFTADAQPPAVIFSCWKSFNWSQWDSEGKGHFLLGSAFVLWTSCRAERYKRRLRRIWMWRHASVLLCCLSACTEYLGAVIRLTSAAWNINHLCLVWVFLFVLSQYHAPWLLFFCGAQRTLWDPRLQVAHWHIDYVLNDAFRMRRSITSPSVFNLKPGLSIGCKRYMYLSYG